MKTLATKFLLQVVAISLMLSTLSVAQKKGARGANDPVKRGEYLVWFGSCRDCHTPKVMTPMGPIPDSTRSLSGHPANEVLPATPAGLFGPDKWGALTNNNLTAWIGPWGTTYARNLTPDTATGLGSWTESMFIKTMRTGKHMGEGRDLLPPMPWQSLAQLTNDDLKAIWAYLRSIKPIENAVPDPLAPTGEAIPTPTKKE